MKIKQLFEDGGGDTGQEQYLMDGDEIEEILEVSYKGNIGIHELSMFYAKATPQQKQELQKLISLKDVDSVWDLVYKVTGMKITR